jgi:hypothetical protein
MGRHAGLNWALENGTLPEPAVDTEAAAPKPPTILCVDGSKIHVSIRAGVVHASIDGGEWTMDLSASDAHYLATALHVLADHLGRRVAAHGRGQGGL